ncbi:hypothetical protein GOP47_0024392 [Adiantum capillus-veneris]|uniref:Uncharacterized protein n=1 Tax=Adiantum capillus-veneris TaxID=13818 RepID=A0A9D4U276_ADICA|nr:hypothetical protein GOP47_0024392 [Adiantum capillus-veneris]
MESQEVDLASQGETLAGLQLKVLELETQLDTTRRELALAQNKLTKYNKKFVPLAEEDIVAATANLNAFMSTSSNSASIGFGELCLNEILTDLTQHVEL